jgi:hypothetical protein
MPSPKGTRAGLLLILTAGPFLVFLFLHLFGKNHFELDRYQARLGELVNKQRPVSEKGLLLLDTADTPCRPEEWKAQLRRFELFTEDFGDKPEWWFPSKADLNSTAMDWLRERKTADVKSARGSGKKVLPDPPRALLFDSEKTLRGVYGLCNDRSVDSLMLEYRILLSN